MTRRSFLKLLVASAAGLVFGQLPLAVEEEIPYKPQALWYRDDYCHSNEGGDHQGGYCPNTMVLTRRFIKAAYNIPAS